MGVRGVDSYETTDVHLDAQISINTPVLQTPNSVREAHLDAPDKLFIGLFYLRTDDDDSTGGDLEIARWRKEPRGMRGPMAYRKFVEVVETVPYARNTLILFVNSPNSLHGVTVRSRTKAPRLFMNLVGDVSKRRCSTCATTRRARGTRRSRRRTSCRASCSRGGSRGRLVTDHR